MSYHIEINEYQRRLIMKALTSTDRQSIQPSARLRRRLRYRGQRKLKKLLDKLFS